MKVKITHDVYEISKRIKEIDRDYYIVYNTSSGNFEVHNSSEKGGSFCLSLPFKFLDERVLHHVLKTSTKNIEKILDEIDRENKLKENADKSQIENTANQMIEDELKNL